MAKKNQWTVRRFTATVLEQIEQRRRRADYPYLGVLIPEEYQAGFTIKVNKRYSLFCVRYAKRVYEIGRVGIMQLDEARTEAKRIIHQVTTHGGAQYRANHTETLADLARRHLEWTKEDGEHPLRPKTWAKYERTWERVCEMLMPLDPDARGLSKPFGEFKLVQVSKAHIRLLRSEFSDRQTQFNRIRSMICAAFNLAEGEWDLRASNTNPCHGVRRYPEKRRRMPWLTPEMLLECLHMGDRFAAEGKIHPSIPNVWWTLFLTGWRPSQAREIETSWVDWSACTVTFPRTKTTTEPKVEYLPPELLGRLTMGRVQSQGRRFLFPGLDGEGAISQQAINRAWHRVRDAAGHPKVIQYAFRHNLRTQAVEAGLSPEHAADVMGHASVTMSETYRQTQDQRRHEAAGKLASHLMALDQRQRFKVV